jgi:hypothetical protein
MIPPEPPVGATVIDRRGHTWHRTEASWWCACDDWDYTWAWSEVWGDADEPIQVKLPEDAA